MVAITLSCRHCGSPDLTKYGIAPNGKQKYFCRTCRRQSRDNPGTTAYSEQQRETILRAYQERSSLRGLERTFGVARSTVIGWLKKAQHLASLSQTLVPAIPTDPSSIALELDEFWSFVGKKTNQRWVWLALCRKTRQIAAFVIDRGGWGEPLRAEDVQHFHPAQLDAPDHDILTSLDERTLASQGIVPWQGFHEFMFYCRDLINGESCQK